MGNVRVIHLTGMNVRWIYKGRTRVKVLLNIYWSLYYSYPKNLSSGLGFAIPRGKNLWHFPNPGSGTVFSRNIMQVLHHTYIFSIQILYTYFENKTKNNKNYLWNNFHFMNIPTELLLVKYEHKKQTLSKTLSLILVLIKLHIIPKLEKFLSHSTDLGFISNK